MAIESLNLGTMQTTPYNGSHLGAAAYGTWRGIGSSWVNQQVIAAEDWQRNEQAQDNQLVRDLYYMQESNKFNASEAEKQRTYEERLASTQYQRAVADMKAAGLNPVLAYGSPAAVPSGASANSSGGRSSSSNRSGSSGNDPLNGILSTVIQVLAGMYTAGASNATKLATSTVLNKTRENVANTHLAESLYRDDKWREWYDKKKR